MSEPQNRGATQALVACLLVCLTATWVVGQLLVVMTTRYADGDPAMSVLDLQEAFTAGYGSLLEAQVKGPMRQHLDDASEVVLLTSWAQLGAGEARYRQDVAALVEERCVRCHRRGGQASFRPLATYEQLRAVAHAPSAPPIKRQLLVTKVHLVGIGLMLAVTSFLFLRHVPPTSALGRWRTPLITVAYGGLFLDFASWWLMRHDLGFAWGRVLGNFGMSSAFLLMVLATLSFSLFTKSETSHEP